MKNAGEEKFAWKYPEHLTEVVESYDAEVKGEAANGADWYVEFIGPEGVGVVCQIAKARFESLPHAVQVGTHFWIVFYRYKGGRCRAALWPVARYWHESWGNKAGSKHGQEARHD
jgi:hypothetical protein